ncbi:MAG: inositol monophosphatase [Actinomycetales bacterium]|nr:inositol monophosphatase [Actinomycetales bacterium]
MTWATDQLPDPQTLRELGALALRVARAAATLVHEGRPDRLDTSTKSSDTDVVTIMDTRSEAQLRTALRAARPADGFVGEEGEDLAGTTGITWVVDPIDGTVNYLYDLPMYAVSVAAVLGSPRGPAWRPVVGAVVSPVLNLAWTALVGQGAARHDLATGARTPLSVGTQTDLGHALIGTGFGYRADTRAEQARTLVEVLPRVRDIRRLGSAATDLCLVADGRLDAYYESGLKPWDLAAGRLVVSEAGGVVVGPAGGEPTEEMVVAGNAALVAALRPLVTR